MVFHRLRRLRAAGLLVALLAAQQAAAFDIRELGLPGISFPDPFPVVNAHNRGNINRVGPDDYFFFSTHNKRLALRGGFAGAPAELPVTLENGRDFDLSYLEQRSDPDRIAIDGRLWAKNAYYDPDTSCNWHMAASARLVERPGAGLGWPGGDKTIVVHLSPVYRADSPGGEGPLCADDPDPGNVQQEFDRIEGWRVDDILVGDIGADRPWRYSDFANYAGKYYRDETGDLYLIYTRKIPENGMGIVAQRMVRPRQRAPEPPVTLIESDRRLTSEYRNGPGRYKMQILETGNILKIPGAGGGRWVLLYSVGDFRRRNYKIGVAYAEAMTGRYRKVLVPDAADVWRSSHPGGKEVKYLIQSQHPDWDNYQSAVTAPGVPSIIRDGAAYFLVFAGYDSSARPDATGAYDPAERRAFIAPLEVDIDNPDPARRIRIKGAPD
ncbi:MAG: hypothetical protein ACP5DX_16455 [Paracoccaceae bacterium]